MNWCKWFGHKVKKWPDEDHDGRYIQNVGRCTRCLMIGKWDKNKPFDYMPLTSREQIEALKLLYTLD